MDGNRGDDLNDRMRDERLRTSGLDRSGAPDSNASSESLVGDSMRAGAPRGDAIDVDRGPGNVRRDDVNPGDEIGEAVGGISGVLTGAALGSLGGPIGTIIGGIAGAVSGWWAGRAISEAASHSTGDDDEYYRTHYESAAGGQSTRGFDDVRPAYQLGHIAGRNPDYQSRSFDDVERDLQHGWSSDVSQRHGQWTEVRDYARHAYERGRSSGGSMSGPSTTHGASAAAGGAMGAAGGMAANAAHRVGDALDDTKDRVDGNPSSRPGPDATDSMRRADSMGGGSMGGGSMGGSAMGSSSLGGGSASEFDRVDRPGSIGGAMDRAGDHAENAADRTGNAVERAWDKTKDVAHRAGEKVENALDDTKDRVDGNPSSRPGLDRTDDRDRLV
ncbi:MAG: hypothetical protein ACXW61_09845 [Gemmatirosa sp.]